MDICIKTNNETEINGIIEAQKKINNICKEVLRKGDTFYIYFEDNEIKNLKASLIKKGILTEAEINEKVV
jgi:hypothetical protein